MASAAIASAARAWCASTCWSGSPTSSATGSSGARAFPRSRARRARSRAAASPIVPDMMSLVGCSGEEFEAILRSLDFRMQKRKVKKPAPISPAPRCARIRHRAGDELLGRRSRMAGDRPGRCLSPRAERSRSLRTQPSRLHRAAEPRGTCCRPSAEAPPIAAAAQQPAEAVPVTAEPATKKSRSRSGGRRIPGPSADAPETPAGPGHRNAAKPRAKPQDRSCQDADAPSRGRNTEEAPAAAPRAGKADRPDSPFAVLGALKAQLAPRSLDGEQRQRIDKWLWFARIAKYADASPANRRREARFG